MMSQYGAILDIVAMKTLRSRGQAFVVFRDVSSAVAAVRAMEGRVVFDKPVHVTFARDKSDAIAKLDGSYAERFKRRTEEKQRRIAEQEVAKKAAKKRSKTQGGAQQPAAKVKAVPAAQQGGSGATGGPSAPPPNNVLFVENLAPKCDEMALSALFAQFPGFREAKLVPTKQGIAFVEFENEVMSGVALSALNGFKVDPDHPMRVSFAKR